MGRGRCWGIGHLSRRTLIVLPRVRTPSFPADPTSWLAPLRPDASPRLLNSSHWKPAIKGKLQHSRACLEVGSVCLPRVGQDMAGPSSTAACLVARRFNTALQFIYPSGLLLRPATDVGLGTLKAGRRDIPRGQQQVRSVRIRTMNRESSTLDKASFYLQRL